MYFGFFDLRDQLNVSFDLSFGLSFNLSLESHSIGHSEKVLIGKTFNINYGFFEETFHDALL